VCCLATKFAAELADSGLEIADAAGAIAPLLAVHDGTHKALQNAKKSGFLTASVMNAAQKLLESLRQHSYSGEWVTCSCTDPALSRPHNVHTSYGISR
jgi:hypothetical protein